MAIPKRLSNSKYALGREDEILFLSLYLGNLLGNKPKYVQL